MGLYSQSGEEVLVEGASIEPVANRQPSHEVSACIIAYTRSFHRRVLNVHTPHPQVTADDDLRITSTTRPSGSSSGALSLIHITSTSKQQNTRTLIRELQQAGYFVVSKGGTFPMVLKHHT